MQKGEKQVKNIGSDNERQKTSVGKCYQHKSFMKVCLCFNLEIINNVSGLLKDAASELI